jgi:hypothetical protein
LGLYSVFPLKSIWLSQQLKANGYLSSFSGDLTME